MSTVSRLTLVVACLFSAQLALAKLPPPSEEAKAKAAEAAAKTAWSNKIASFQLCKAQDRAAASYRAKRLPTATEAAAPMVAAAEVCADPGPYVAATPTAPGLEKAGAHSPPATTLPAATGAASAAKS